jgi:hypothetical protein
MKPASHSSSPAFKKVMIVILCLLIAALAGAQFASASPDHSLGLANPPAGQVVGWGSTARGQANIPAGLTDVTAIVTGDVQSGCTQTATPTASDTSTPTRPATVTDTSTPTGTPPRTATPTATPPPHWWIYLPLIEQSPRIYLPLIERDLIISRQTATP